MEKKTNWQEYKAILEQHGIKNYTTLQIVII